MPRSFVLFGALALALAGSLQAGSRAVWISSVDAVSAPGKSVLLKAKIERQGWGFPKQGQSNKGIWRADLKDKKLDFYLGDTLLGSDQSDEEGWAQVAFDPPATQDYSIEVRFAGDDRYAPGTDDLFVAVRDPSQKPTVIIDIDHTLSHTSNRNVIKGSIDDKPLEYSKEVVEKLNEKYSIVYVTARYYKFLDVTKRWIKHWGYPRHPMFLLDLKKYPTYDEAAYKIDTIGAIKAVYPNTVLGLGDKDSDAEAYRHHGLRALILGDAGGVSGAEEVADWHEIESLVLSARNQKAQAIFAELGK